METGSALVVVAFKNVCFFLEILLIDKKKQIVLIFCWTQVLDFLSFIEKEMSARTLS